MPRFPLSDRFLKQLPDGKTVDDLVFIEVAAQVTELDQSEVQVALAKFAEAGPEPMGSDGKPTIMKVVAWMVHEGANSNRQYFVRDELQALAPTLFHEPNFGVMDFNHSAARDYASDPKVVGVWYKAEYRYDESAQRYGLVASGMLFSWLFPDHANKLLAEQARNGRMVFSMAAMPMYSRMGHDENGPYKVIGDPVFFTVSALDIPPGDMHAVGLGSESETDTTLRQRLLAAAYEHPWQQAAGPHSNEGAAMDKELDELKSANERLSEELAAVRAEVEALKAAPDTSALDAVKAELEAALTKVSELETSREAVIAERDAHIARVAELEAEVAELSAFKAEREAADTAAAKIAKFAERFAKLPETFQTAHKARPEEKRQRLEAKWMDIADEQWDEYVEDELLGYKPETAASYLERSNREGVLPVGGTVESDDIAERVRRLLNK